MKFFTLALFASGLSACQSYPFAFQTNQRVDARTYEVQVDTEGSTDILFVIDNSASMAEEQEKLRQNVGEFIQVLTRSVNDYQVGIVSTDIFNRPTASNCEPCCDRDSDGDGLPDFSNCDDGRLVAADGRTRLFKRPVSDDAEELSALTAELIDNVTATITALGTIGNATEASFEAMRRALDPEGEVAVRALNRGFLRADADLAVIFLTDEDDCSHSDESWYLADGRDDSDCYTETSANPVSEYVDFVVGLKGGEVSRIRAAAILGGVPISSEDDPALHPLSFKAAGCVTADTGDATNTCGCWSARYVPDRRPDAPEPPPDDTTGNDLFCNLLSAEPYNQPDVRTPTDSLGQGGCIAMPGARYIQFLEELDRRRDLEEQNEGALAGSICQADYNTTMEEIALKIVLSNCFQLVETPDFTFDDSVVMYRNGELFPRVTVESGLPGWSYNAELNAICLEGGVIKEVGDVFVISVVSDTRGFEEEASAEPEQ